MLLGLSTAAFYGKWETEEAAVELSRLPIDCAEIFLQSGSEFDADFARIVRQNLGSVPCTSVHPQGCQFEAYMAERPARQKRDAFDVFRRVLDAGTALGARTYVYHGRNTPQLFPLPWDMRWNTEALEPMCEETQKHGMVIGWENVFWCQLTEPSRVMEAKRALPQVRFTLDIKQAMRAGCDPIDFVYAMGDQLCNVHVCDWDAKGKLCLPGEGAFDFDRLFDALGEVGYGGPVILEPYLKLIKDRGALLDALRFLRKKMDRQ